VLADLKTSLVGEDELEKVKNQLRVQKIRMMDIMSGMGILFLLGRNTAYGDWSETNNNPDKCDAVTAEDIQRVANTYFASDQRNVLIIRAKAGPEDEESGAEDPRFAQMRQMIQSSTNAERLEQMVGMFSMRLDQVEDKEERAQMERLLKVAAERLKQLKSSEGS